MYRLLNFSVSNKNKICVVAFIIIDIDDVAEMEDNLDLEVCWFQLLLCVMKGSNFE